MDTTHSRDYDFIKKNLVLTHKNTQVDVINRICQKAYKQTDRQARSIHNDYQPRRLWRIIVLAAMLCCCQPILLNASSSISVTPPTVQPPNLFLQYGFTLSPLAIFLSMLAALWSAKLSLAENRRISKQRATFEYLSRLNWDEDFLKSRRIYMELKAGDMKVKKVAEDYHRMRKQKRPNKENFAQVVEKNAAILGLLNEYEAIAIGIDTDTLDDEIIRRNRKSTIMDTLKTCDEFIEVTRENADTLIPKDKIYCEAKALIKRWETEQDGNYATKS